MPYTKGGVGHVDVDTSRAAAEAIEKDAESIQDRIFRHIVSCGDHGATDAEIEMQLKLLHQTASSKRRALVKKNRIIDSGVRRPSPITGRDAIVWVERPMQTDIMEFISPDEDELKTLRASLRRQIGKLPIEKLTRIRDLIEEMKTS